MNFDAITIHKPDFIDLVFIDKIKYTIGDYILSHLYLMLHSSHFHIQDNTFFGDDVKYKIAQFNNVLTYMYMYKSNIREDKFDICQFNVTIDNGNVIIDNLLMDKSLIVTIKTEFCGQEKTYKVINVEIFQIFFSLFIDKLHFDSVAFYPDKDLLFYTNEIRLHVFERYKQVIKNTNFKLVIDKFTSVNSQAKYEIFKTNCKKNDINVYYDATTMLWFDRGEYLSNVQQDHHKRYTMKLLLSQNGTSDLVCDTFEYALCDNPETQNLLRII